MDPLYLDALATLETANGRKTVKGPKGEDSFNLYNIKDLTGTGYRAHDKAEGSNDAYRVYASRDEATTDLLGLLSRKYPAALEAKDAKQFASALKAGGYATDPAYVDKFVNVYASLAAGGGSREDIAVPTVQAASAPTRSLDDLYAAAQGPRPPKHVERTQVAKAVEALQGIQPVRQARPDTEGAWFTRSTEQAVGADRARAEVDQQGLVDIARAQFMSTTGGAILRRLARPEFEPDGFVATEKDLEGFTLEEQDTLRQATSRAEFDYLSFDLTDARERMREASKSGLGWAIAGGLLAGGPEAYVTGGATALLLARYGLGSLALANQGRKAAAAASLAAENVGLGAALTGVQDYLTPDVHVQDYIIGALGDTLGMALHTPAVLRAGRDVEGAALDKILTDAVGSRKADIDTARAELGTGATPAEVNRRARELRSLAIRNDLSEARADVPADRRLLSDETLDELLGEAGDGEAPKPQALEFPTLVSDDAVAAKTGLASDLLNMPYNGRGVLSEAVLGPDVRRANYSADSDLDAIWARNPQAVQQFDREYGISRAQVLQQAAPRSVTFMAPNFAGSHGLPSELQKVALWLHKTFLPDYRIVVMNHDLTPRGKANAAELGLAWNIGSDISIINVKPGQLWQHTLIHEFGHVIFDRHIGRMRSSLADGFRAVHEAWLRRYTGADGQKPARGLSNATDAAVRRGPLAADPVLRTIGVKAPEGFIPSMMDVMAGVVNKVTGDLSKVGPQGQKFSGSYIPNLSEFSAEQFAKYIEAAVADVLDWKPASIPQAVKSFFANLWQAFANLFNAVKQAGLIAPDQRVVDFFEAIRKSAKASETRRDRIAAGLDPYRLEQSELQGPSAMELPQPSAMATAARTDDDIIRDYGLDVLAADMNGGGTKAARAELKAMVELYRKAEAYPMPDEKRMSRLLRSAPLQAVAPTALKLLASKNPVARMVAAELLESGGGAGGRKSTAAVAKWMYEREFMGNTVNDLQRAYVAWRNANGGNVREDFLGGKKWDEFNRLVAVEMENRRAGRVSDAPPAVHTAADVLEGAYDRMRKTQLGVKTPGWQALPESSFGYMPHRMSPAKVRDMTPDQARVLHSVLMDQFISIEGFDPTFSAKLASRYIDTVKKRATAGYGAPMGVTSADAADIVEESILAMGMTRQEAQQMAKRVRSAAPKHTRSRLDLDLTRTYSADGRSFQLLDLFEYDQLSLVRSQASRVSGEAALTRHGIPGSTGLKLLRRAIGDFGSAEGKADNATLEAFDQVAAEFLGTPFGTASSKWLDRALQFNSLASLGGMGFNQLAETLNGAVTLGARYALASVGSLGRLRAEILALSRGQSVNNPIIGSLETYGAEFGTDHYKLVFPFDNPERSPGIYGVEDITVADRLLRAGSHLQGKLSLWRAITSTQERGMAEQIVHKALRYVREGGDGDKALADMGITGPLLARLREELPNVARFDARGRLVEFDITKLSDQTVAGEFVQAVHRGTRQIIQGTFIGETGKWAHSGFLKLLTQFRTFSLVAIDKQWNRQVGNHGTAAALGILLGTMSFAAPIVMIRAGISSIGRPDQDEYLEKRLAPTNIARETLNYVALSGLSGDLLDALSAVTGHQPTGGRTGTNKSFVGNVVAPAVGRANDLWGALQNSRDGTDIHGLVQQLPFSRLPALYPAINALREDR